MLHYYQLPFLTGTSHSLAAIRLCQAYNLFWPPVCVTKKNCRARRAGTTNALRARYRHIKHALWEEGGAGHQHVLKHQPKLSQKAEHI